MQRFFSGIEFRSSEGGADIRKFPGGICTFKQLRNTKPQIFREKRFMLEGGGPPLNHHFHLRNFNIQKFCNVEIS